MLDEQAPASKKHRSLFAFGVLGGLLAEQMVLFAIPLLIYQNTGSLAALGLAYAVEWIPALIAYPFAGLLADRDGGRRLFRRSNTLRGIVLLSVASVVLLVPDLTTTALMVGGGALAVLSAPVRMCIEKMVPQLAGKRELAATQSLVQNMELLAMALGPGLAVLGAVLVGKVWLLGLAAVVFAIAAWCWTPLPRRSAAELQVAASGGSAAVAAELRLGLSLLVRNRPVVLLAGLNFSINLVLAVTLSINAAVVTGVFGAPEFVLAVLTTCVGFIGLINLFATPLLLRRMPVQVLGVFGFAVLCVACLVLAVAPSITIYGVAYVAALAGTALFNIYNRTQRVRVVPSPHLGKVMGPFYLINLLSLPLGGLLVAAFGDLIGPRGLIGGLSVGLVVIGMTLLPLTLRSFRAALSNLEKLPGTSS
ncbi:MAG: hypothetical protein AVDCRST_MAG66-1676 [uncultured Pseudonocardia sp.]|uniref:Major facilitator superfamily (MFS) profile domain-containing protein n=1 Tax=uncultured Pseudonocardia sp. TaxID=211455 RepID=A0A6J4P5C3_9PSEU|nr:MAG: hypothetical protein AVDCRST_MAG66-1676 [uncultured Pseudonocardia sp.]